jgi:hypothetical protein
MTTDFRREEILVVPTRIGNVPHGFADDVDSANNGRRCFHFLGENERVVHDDWKHHPARNNVGLFGKIAQKQEGILNAKSREEQKQSPSPTLRRHSGFFPLVLMVYHWQVDHNDNNIE